jgi:hypothetical protein
MNKTFFWKKVKIQDSMGKNKLFFKHPALQPLGSFCHMADCRSSSKNTGKLNLIPVLNKNSPWAHTESELDMLGVHIKLVKNLVHLSKRKNGKKLFFNSLAAQATNDQFLVSRNLGVEVETQLGHVGPVLYK